MEKKFTREDIKKHLNHVLDNLKNELGKTVDNFQDETVELTFRMGPTSIYELIGVALVLMQEAQAEREVELLEEILGDSKGPLN